METSLAALLEGRDEREFLRVTSTALKIVQNIQNEPSEMKYRRLKAASAFCCKPGTSLLLEALGFEQRGKYYVLDETFVPSLSSKNRDILAARRATRSILGWDVPFSMLKFMTAFGTCKYGEVFGGSMNDEDVVIKTLKPDGGEMARECFDRELDLLHKLNHPNIIQLQSVTLTSDPTCIILELIPSSLLEVLNHTEFGDAEIITMAIQIAHAIDYLHTHGVLHCDIGARNIRLTNNGVVKLCDLGLARKEDGVALSSEQVRMLPLRWTAPEVLQQHQVTRYSDLWSYGVFLYELVTSGSVPYASFNNQQVRSKVTEGYRLPQPHNCPDELYSLMLHCWLPRATERLSFSEVIRNRLDPLMVKVKEGRLTRLNSNTSEESGGEGKSSTLKSSRGSTSSSSGSHKLKVKEPSYPQVLSKGGGLLRVYTALISPFHHRATIVCGKKTTTSEVVQTALAKCGKQELDHRAYSIAIVNPHSIATPARYLAPDERVLGVKTESTMAADFMFVLCVYSPDPAILEIVNSIKQNPAYESAFDLCTRGYLVAMETGEKTGTGKRGKQASVGQRRWCVLDGSSLLCYKDEEDEDLKQYESFVNVKNSSVSALSGKKNTMVRVGMADGGEFVFSAADKGDMLYWIEAISASSHLEPSTMLLHFGDGVIVQTGYLDCQEFALESSGVSPLQSSSPLNRRLGKNADFSGTYSAVDYGRHWTVLKSSGLIQCLIRGRPETLFSLTDAIKVKIHNPRREKEEGGHYYISLYDTTSRIVLQAECPSDHFDWTVAIERVLEDKGLQARLCGDRGNQSGYVTLKRLMMMQEGGKLGDRGSAMQLYAMPRILDTLDDVYDPPVEKFNPQQPNSRGYENNGPIPPLSPPSYVNFIPPPPLPPRTVGVPPLPPKGTSSGNFSPGVSGVIYSKPENDDEIDDEYVLMNPQSLPATPSGLTHISSPPHSVPTTPNDAHPRQGITSQPISIPSCPSGKQSKLLRSLSEASSTSPSSPRHTNISSSSSLPRHNPSSSFSATSSRSLPRKQVSLTTQESLVSSPSGTPTLSEVTTHSEATGGGAGTRTGTPSGYGSSLDSPFLEKSQSNQFVKPVSTTLSSNPEDFAGCHGDDVTMGACPHPISQVTSVLSIPETKRQLSDGYSSSHSSTDEIIQRLPVGWRKGYCDSRIFFVNTETGRTTWSIQDVIATNNIQKTSTQPGGKWQVVTLEDGQVYYYHEVTRETTWNVTDTFT